MRRTRKGRYEDYQGARQWEVAHPRYGKCHVLSPDPDSAMVAAAIVWGTRWQAVEFYSQCEVLKI